MENVGSSPRSRREIPQPAGIYLDYGPELPDRYGRAAMRLMWQSPRRVFAQWEWPEPPLEPPILVLRDLTGAKAELFHVASDVAEYWFEAQPDRRYQVELQIGERVVMTSNAVLTPREGPSAVIDPEWPVDEATMQAIFKASGAADVGKGTFYP